MDWLDKIRSQVNRVFPGAALPENATEAEVTNFLEGMEPVNEVVAENSETIQDIVSRLSVLENKDFDSFVSQESLTEKLNVVNQAATANKTAVEANLTAIQANTKLVNDTKKVLATDINALKTPSSGKKKDVDPAPPTPDNSSKSDDKKDEMTVNMNDIFKSEIVPGLNI